MLVADSIMNSMIALLLQLCCPNLPDLWISSIWTAGPVNARDALIQQTQPSAEEASYWSANSPTQGEHGTFEV